MKRIPSAMASKATSSDLLPSLSGVGFSGIPEREISFPAALATVRRDRELTIFEIAEKTRHTTRTVERWLAGSTAPNRATRSQVLQILSDPNAEPSARMRRRAEESHHLIWDKQKGWEVRVTFDLGPKRMGKRIRERLKTRDLAEAITRKEILMSNWKRLGLKVADRRQKRRSTPPS